MSPVKSALFAITALLLAANGCVGTTGGELLDIDAAAAGPPDARGPMTFENSRGYRVTLTEARLFVGGIYLNRARPLSGAADTTCTQAGIYVAEVLGARDVNLLSAEPQSFSRRGFATTDAALSGEVWLASGDVNEPSSSVTILRVSGVAERDGQALPFEGKLSIGNNRLLAPSDPSLPGQHPICKQRVVTPIPVDVQLRAGTTLLLRIDPRGMFANVDFSTLGEAGGVYQFADAFGVDQASDNLYSGMRRSTGVYAFSALEAK